MVYLEILGAVIVAILLENVPRSSINSLRHVIVQWMQGFPSRFEVKMCQVLLQECTLNQNTVNQHAFFEKKNLRENTTHT